MPKLINISGSRFGRLTATSLVSGSSRGSVWLCKCDCGNTIEMARKSLVARKSAHCGCGDTHPKSVRWAYSRWAGASIRSRNLSREFALTLEQFSNLMLQACHYCGAAWSGVRVGVQSYNGVDRVDSSRGYTTDNCVPCCAWCNRMKTNFHVTDFLDHASAIHSHRATN